jgi:hypothetical protein
MRTREEVGTSTAKNSAKKKTAEQVPNIEELLWNGPRFGDYRAYARSGTAAGR